MTQYLRHIDGLRAISVLVVLLFHFKIFGFERGFLGVDVFFVISGFLVTRIVVYDFQSVGHLQWRRFFTRRVRRLFPALAVTCFFTAVAAYLFANPVQLASFGLSLSATIISASNILFWFEAGYFDAASESKPLLHTWSLSVEEQFYFIWPLLLAYSMKVAGWSRIKFILPVLLFLGSLALSIYWLSNNFDADKNSTVFFWMPFRVYELMIGALCFTIWNARENGAFRKSITPAYASIGALLGFCLFFAALFIPLSFVGITDPWTDIQLGLLVCFGAALLIMFYNNPITRIVLENGLFRWVGQLSYSLYLVHWPLWVFAHELFDNSPQWQFVFMMTTSFALACLLHYFIENPIRRHGLKPVISYIRLTLVQRWPLKAEIAIFGLVAILIAQFGYFLNTATSLPWRTNPIYSAQMVKEGKDNRFNLIRQGCNVLRLDTPFCDLTRETQILVFGNSHEPDGYNSLHEIFNANSGVNLISFGTVNGCNIRIQDGKIFDDTSARQCSERATKLNELVESGIISHIVYSANQPYAPNKVILWDVINQMMENGSSASLSKSKPEPKLIVMGGFINTRKDCPEIANINNQPEDCFLPESVSVFPSLELKQSKLLNTEKYEYLYINRIGLMCTENDLKTCMAEAYDEPFSYDRHHLSAGYAKLIGELIQQNYKDELIRLKLPI